LVVFGERRAAFSVPQRRTELRLELCCIQEANSRYGMSADALWSAINGVGGKGGRRPTEKMFSRVLQWKFQARLSQFSEPSFRYKEFSSVRVPYFYMENPAPHGMRSVMD
jgi:hypothetical protein